MADGDLAIIIKGWRGDWPGGPRILMARPPSREPNGRTCWFGAELDSDGDQVWFRLDDEAKDDVARALQTLQAAASPSPEDQVVPLSPQMVGLRFQAAARAAGVEPVTAHSGRVGLASELTRRGASTTDVMLAGNWKTSRMVAHYSSGATVERGAVAHYL